MDTTSRRALITGGLGFIGSTIARRLLADRHVDEVVLLDHYGSYITPTRRDFVEYRGLRVREISDRVIIERGQAHHSNVMSHLLWTYRPEYIFHLAAIPLASLSNMNTQEAIEGTVISTALVLEICSHLKQDVGYEPRRFVYASSSMVYGDFRYNPADEDHPRQPINLYGTAKLAGEEVTLGLCRVYGIKGSVIRPSAVYGPTDMNRRVTQIFLEDALAGRKLVIHGEEEKLDFTYVEDTAKGFVLAATRDEGVGQVFNITSGHAHTLHEYVEVLREHFPDLQYEVRPRDTTRPARGTLAIERARRLLGYEPDWTLRAGVAAYLDFVRAHGKPREA